MRGLMPPAPPSGWRAEMALPAALARPSLACPLPRRARRLRPTAFAFFLPLLARPACFVSVLARRAPLPRLAPSLVFVFVARARLRLALAVAPLHSRNPDAAAGNALSHLRRYPSQMTAIPRSARGAGALFAERGIDARSRHAARVSSVPLR